MRNRLSQLSTPASAPLSLQVIRHAPDRRARSEQDAFQQRRHGAFGPSKERPGPVPGLIALRVPEPPGLMELAGASAAAAAPAPAAAHGHGPAGFPEAPAAPHREGGEELLHLPPLAARAPPPPP